MSRARSVRSVGQTLAAALVATCLLGNGAIAQATGTYSVRPGQSNPAEPITRAYFKPLLRPGHVITQSVVVANTGASTVHLLVYPVDGLTGQTTGTVYADRSDPVRKAGRWVTVSVSKLTVAVGEQIAIPFTVRVPARAQPGDHVAGIAFEGANPTTAGGGHFRIKEIIREVIGIQIRVPGRASPHLALGGVQLKALPGTRVASVVVGLGNLGLALCKPSLAVSLRGPNAYRRSVARQLDTVLPGDTVAYPLPWPGSLQDGSYAASASASCNGQRVTRFATLRLGKPLGPSTRPHVPPAAAGHGPIPVWIFIMVALGGLGLGVALTQVRATRRHRVALAAAAAGPGNVSPPAITSVEQADTNT